MEQVSISSGDSQTPSNHNGTPDLVNRLNLTAPTRSTVVEVAGNGVPGTLGQSRHAIRLDLQLPWINLAG